MRKQRYFVRDLVQQHQAPLRLVVAEENGGMDRQIWVPEAQRPGLGLAGFMKSFVKRRILIFGRVELQYLQELSQKEQRKRVKNLINPLTPAVIVTRGFKPPEVLKQICFERGVSLLRSKSQTMKLVTKLTYLLGDAFASIEEVHGTLVEVFGVGVLIKGDSSVGKSEAALGLIERGHRLISDDVVKLKRGETDIIIGSGIELTKHHMEIRGIGIINVAHLYGAVCVKDRKELDLVVELEEWNESSYYDRLGTQEESTELLGVNVPYHLLPVKPSRDVVLLLETIALNHRLKRMGYNSAKEFNTKLLRLLAKKDKAKRGVSFEV